MDVQYDLHYTILDGLERGGMKTPTVSSGLGDSRLSVEDGAISSLGLQGELVVKGVGLEEGRERREGEREKVRGGLALVQEQYSVDLPS